MIECSEVEARLRRDALSIFAEALNAADAKQTVSRHLTKTYDGFAVADRLFKLDASARLLLLAVGKAAVPMAEAVESIIGPWLSSGLVVTKHGHGENNLSRCRVLEAGHPIPDAAGLAAARSVTEFAHDLTSRDVLLVCVSGGASALLPAPPSPITLADKQQTTDLLLRAGADIRQLNTVRKQLSTLKGGRLAALAYPATVIGLLLSDVIGDDMGIIGSGVTVPDSSTPAEAFAVLSHFGLIDQISPSVPEYLMDQILSAFEPRPVNALNFVVGSNHLALAAAADKARELGYLTVLEAEPMRGEARTAGFNAVQSAVALKINSGPCCWLCGGETTVTVSGAGLGGRNQEFALAAALALSRETNVLVLSAGTDGTDGPTDAAGAIATGTTIHRGRELGLDANNYLARNDSYRYFDALSDLVRTGPTGTNVMDICIVLSA